jgi:hypothetical protein
VPRNASATHDLFTPSFMIAGLNLATGVVTGAANGVERRWVDTRRCKYSLVLAREAGYAAVTPPARDW